MTVWNSIHHAVCCCAVVLLLLVTRLRVIALSSGWCWWLPVKVVTTAAALCLDTGHIGRAPASLLLTLHMKGTHVCKVDYTHYSTHPHPIKYVQLYMQDTRKDLLSFTPDFVETIQTESRIVFIPYRYRYSSSGLQFMGKSSACLAWRWCGLPTVQKYDDDMLTSLRWQVYITPVLVRGGQCGSGQWRVHCCTMRTLHCVLVIISAAND